MTQLTKMDWDPVQIRVELIKKGVSQSALARELGVWPSTIGKIIDGLSASDRIRRAIAAAIGRDVREIWPSAYLRPDGPPKPGRPKSRPVKLFFGTRK
jgi:lambda repressor-like predicted transcriptional regulator